MTKKIDIIEKLSRESYLNIKKLLEVEIRTILLKNAARGAGLDKNLKHASFKCDYINMFDFDYGKNSANQFLINSTFKNKDTWSSYSIIAVSAKLEHNIDYRTLYKEADFAFQLPSGTKFKYAEIYGVSCVDEVLDFDEDFPENKTLISNDSDCMIKLGGEMSNFILIWAKEDFMYFSFGNTDESFKEFLSMTRRVWGEHKGYRYKYSIEI